MTTFNLSQAAPHHSASKLASSEITGMLTKLSLRLSKAWQTWQARQAQARSDERFLATALRDKRVMDELLAAKTQQRG